MQYMEFSAFFFGYAGLFMAMLEYEMRHYLEYGEYMEGITPNYTEPLGITPGRARMLKVLLALNLLSTAIMCWSILSRYKLNLKWKIQKKLLISSDSLYTTKEY